MSKWISVVSHENWSGDQIGETLVNLDNVAFIVVPTNTIGFLDGSYITINKESMKVLLDAIETIGDKA